jgi:hypothetical protein
MIGLWGGGNSVDEASTLLLTKLLFFQSLSTLDVPHGYMTNALPGFSFSLQR